VPPIDHPCFPDDKDYLDGRREIMLPKGEFTAHWDLDILDVNGVRPNRIISIRDAFEVRFRVELIGRLWYCMCGTWCFDVGFTPIGKGSGFNLRDKVSDPGLFDFKWCGCERRCIEVCIPIPAGTVPAECCGTLYEVGAVFKFHCCDKLSPLTGYEPKHHYEFYDPDE
jgi:hypothetical protein